MLNYQDRLQIKQEILEVFKDVFGKGDFLNNLQVQKKSDHSRVTVIDFKISEIIKKHIMSLPQFKKFTFFCEEEYEELKFPAVIVDPVDGTNELIKGLPECAISVGIFPDNGFSNGFGWIFNPFTGFEICSEDIFQKAPNSHDGVLFGLISRSEIDKGLFKDVDQKNIIIAPKGSIANKLGLMAAGACDFIISKKPKSIWDVAGGTILTHAAGYRFFVDGKEIVQLNQNEYQPPLCWCKSKEEYDKLMRFVS